MIEHDMLEVETYDLEDIRHFFTHRPWLRGTRWLSHRQYADLRARRFSRFSLGWQTEISIFVRGYAAARDVPWIREREGEGAR